MRLGVWIAGLSVLAACGAFGSDGADDEVPPNGSSSSSSSGASGSLADANGLPADPEGGPADGGGDATRIDEVCEDYLTSAVAPEGSDPAVTWKAGEGWTISITDLKAAYVERYFTSKVPIARAHVEATIRVLSGSYPLEDTFTFELLSLYAGAPSLDPSPSVEVRLRPYSPADIFIRPLGHGTTAPSPAVGHVELSTTFNDTIVVVAAYVADPSAKTTVSTGGASPAIFTDAALQTSYPTLTVRVGGSMKGKVQAGSAASTNYLLKKLCVSFDAP